jgi:hypothetical protein
MQRGVQRYVCKDCGVLFRNERKKHASIKKTYWLDYVFHKQTIRELAEQHTQDRRTIKKQLESYTLPEKKHNPRPIHLLVDATFFGERTDDTSWCVVVFRDFYNKEDLWWGYYNTETTSAYRTGRLALESLGYTILSVTADGFGGIKQAFYDIPYQMCLVHMERLLRKGTTRNPKTEAGKALRALTLSLFDTTSEIFKQRYKYYLERYAPFLNQKTFNPETGRQDWTHDKLRTASLSLFGHLPYLFTYEHNDRIPQTSNALEAHFRHIKEVLAVHCGLSRIQKQKVITTILLASTIAPSEEVLKLVFG